MIGRDRTQRINRESLRTLVRRGAQLIEVLPKDEYEEVHLAGAVNIPLAMISRLTADRLEWEKPVIVYSRDSLCDISARAAWRLSSMGFTQVFRYTAGKADWLANGLPVEGNRSRTQDAGDVADLDVPTCKRSDRIRDIRDRVQKEGWDHCVVVNEQLIVLGLLRPVDFEKADPGWPAEEVMDRDPQTFRLNTPLSEVRAYFAANPHITSALVTTTDGALFGLLRLQDLEQ